MTVSDPGGAGMGSELRPLVRPGPLILTSAERSETWSRSTDPRPVARVTSGVRGCVVWVIKGGNVTEEWTDEDVWLLCREALCRREFQSWFASVRSNLNLTDSSLWDV